jgi:hypothetical protein
MSPKAYVLMYVCWMQTDSQLIHLLRTTLYEASRADPPRAVWMMIMVPAVPSAYASLYIHNKKES